MRTNIDIDDKLMKQAMRATGATTKKAAVEASMQLAIRLKAQEGIKKLRGKVVWRGPDDDWSISDEEVMSNRRQAERKAVSTEAPTADERIVGTGGRR
jgi:Arc/MetJ family transcription regulator